ncbi:FUSC family protein [Winogradskyella sp. 3972H.M.0a.05]|uniref:FUSC family protein n=1 Tax=Winogradskyella sp. 3972H.M.0a.05 TaxID=2950277 RepID=UPI003390FDCF
MRKFLIVLGFIVSILAVVLSVTPLYKVSAGPAVLALLIGFVLIYLSKKQNASKKVIQYIFLLTIISLTVTTYKAIFEKTELGDTQEIEELEKKSEEEAIEELNDLEID